MLLDDCVDDIGKFYFDRGVWAFGEAVANRLEEIAAESNNPVIARARREREWARLMGDDMSTSGAGFADVGEGVSPHARVVGDGDEVALGEDELNGNYW